MTLRISGKSISVGEALRTRVGERTDEVLRKYFDGNYSGHITLSKDGFGFRTDCALHLDSGVVLEAEHLCMSLRGVQKQGAKTVTSALHGLVRDDARTRQEFLALTTRTPHGL